MKTLSTLIQNWLRKLSLHGQRSEQETRSLGAQRDTLFKVTIIIVFFTFSLWPYVGPLLDRIQIWTKPAPILAIQDSDWKTLHQDAGTDDYANPQVPAWKNATPRSDTSHRQWVKEHPGSPYWVGVHAPSSLLKQAKEQNANQLILGWIVGKAQIWIDGVLYVEQEQLSSNPLILNLPYSLLNRSTSLFIAIRIVPLQNHAWPDILNKMYGGQGFVTAKSANYFREMISFSDQIRPFSLFLVGLLISSAFLFFWSSARKKQEYYYLALYVFTESALQIPKFGPILETFFSDPRKSLMLNRYEFTIYTLLGTFAILLGLSFARIRNSISSAILFVSVSTVLSVLTFAKTPIELLQAKDFLVQWLIPACFFLGAAACALQAIGLSSNQARKHSLSTRISRLRSFAFWMTAAGILQLLMGWGQDFYSFTSWQRLAYFGCVIAMGHILLKDYRETERIRESISFSEFHQPSMLDQPVHGTILMLDVKACEVLFRAGVAQGSGDKFIAPLMNRLCAEIEVFGGIRISIVDGDMIKAFFPDRDRTGLVRSIEASCAMVHYLETHTQELIAQGVLENGRTLSFRAGVATGSIKAVMDRTGPNWAHADGSLPFVEAARMMEMESEWSSDKNTTYIFVTQSGTRQLLQSRTQLDGIWVNVNFRQSAKHGVEYSAGIFQPASGAKVIPITRSA